MNWVTIVIILTVASVCCLNVWVIIAADREMRSTEGDHSST